MRGWNYGPYWLIGTLLLLVIYAFIAMWVYDRKKSKPYDQEKDP